MWHTRTIVELKETPPSRNQLNRVKKTSTLASFIIYPMILCHFICHMMGKKAMYQFQKILYCCWENPFFPYMIRKMTLYFEICIVKNSLSCKINPIFGISTQKYTGKSIQQWKIISNQISPVGYPRVNLMEKPLGGVQVKFGWKLFFIAV